MRSYIFFPKQSDIRPKGFYVYTHTRLDTGEVFYVGKGHANRAFRPYYRNKWWHHVARQTVVYVDIIKDDLTECCAYTLEKCIIGINKSKGFKLCNITDGGDGVSMPGELNPFYGKKHTEDTKIKMAANRKPLKGKSHPCYDFNDYFLFHPEFGIVNSNRSDLVSLTGLNKTHIDSIVNGTRLSRKGWCLLENKNKPKGYDTIRGERNKLYDNKVRIFQNKDGCKFVGTAFDFCKKYDLCRSEVSAIIKGRKNTHKGWSYVCEC
jgi:hypothetical protein